MPPFISSFRDFPRGGHHAPCNYTQATNWLNCQDCSSLSRRGKVLIHTAASWKLSKSFGGSHYNSHLIHLTWAWQTKCWRTQKSLKCTKSSSLLPKKNCSLVVSYSNIHDIYEKIKDMGDFASDHSLWYLNWDNILIWSQKIFIRNDQCQQSIMIMEQCAVQLKRHCGGE